MQQNVRENSIILLYMFYDERHWELFVDISNRSSHQDHDKNIKCQTTKALVANICILN